MGVSVGTRRGGRADSCREGRGRSSGGPGRASDASSARDAPPRRSRRCSSRPAWRSSWRRGSRRTRRSPCSTGRRDAGWLPRPVPCGDSGAPSARRGAVRRVTRACALSARVREVCVALQATSGSDTPSSARAKCAMARRAAASSRLGGTKRLRNGFSESGFARFVTQNRIDGWGLVDPRPRRGARRAAVIRREREMHSDLDHVPVQSRTLPPAVHRASHLPARWARPRRRPRTPRRPRDVLAGGRPPRGFGDRVGRVRCGGLDRPGERHLSSLGSRRALLRAASVPRVDWTGGVTARTTSSPPRSKICTRARAPVSPRSPPSGEARKARISACSRSPPSPVASAQALLRPHRQHARRRAHGPRVHPPIPRGSCASPRPARDRTARSSPVSSSPSTSTSRSTTARRRTRRAAVALARDARLFLLPTVNPDGFAAKRRANANGRDLNRDFPDQFDHPGMPDDFR